MFMLFDVKSTLFDVTVARTEGPRAAPCVPRNFWKVTGPSKRVRGPGILWLPCNSNTGNSVQDMIKSLKRLERFNICVYWRIHRGQIPLRIWLAPQPTFCDQMTSTSLLLYSTYDRPTLIIGSKHGC